MAIAIDAVSSTTCDGCSSITISHTCSGADRLILVCVSYDPDDFETITGVTYNGVSLSSQIQVNEGDDAHAEIFTLVAPATGANDAVVTFSAALRRQAVVGVISLTGVDQSTPVTATASGNGLAGSSSINVASATDELVIDCIAGEQTTSFTAGAGQTERWNLNDSSFTYGAGSTEPGATTTTMSWTFGSSDYYAHVAVSVAPSAGGASIIPMVHNYRMRQVAQ